MCTPEAAGIDPNALSRYIREHIYTLPGTTRHRQAFTVLVTGSRAAGVHTPDSDVDIDVLCPEPVHESVQRASYEAGIVGGEASFFCVLKGDDWDRYFGRKMGRPHFSLTGLDRVEQHFRDCDDVWMWIWLNAKVIADPAQQFQRIVNGWDGYPADVLVRKIKYRWLLAAYWEVDVFPYHHCGDDEVLAASAAILNAVNELLRLFFLVEGRPFPYTEKLMHLAPSTVLGAELVPQLHDIVDLVVGKGMADLPVWDRLHRACELLCVSDKSEECRRLEDACAQAMVAAGVDAKWVEADYQNIDELLLGELGPMP